MGWWWFFEGERQRKLSEAREVYKAAMADYSASLKGRSRPVILAEDVVRAFEEKAAEKPRTNGVAPKIVAAR